MRNFIVLNEIVSKGNIVYYNFSCNTELDGYFRKKQLFIEYPEDISSVPESILSIPFIATFLGIAWLENANLYVKELDRTYYYSLREVRNAFQDMYYNVSLRGSIIACNIVDNYIPKDSQSIMLFGGGVDAHTTFIRKHEKIVRICNIQGWFKSEDANDIAAEADRNHCLEFSEKEGIKFDYIRSNFAWIVNAKKFNLKFQRLLGDQWWHGIQHSMAFISIVIPLSFYYKLSNIIIASSLTIGRPRPCGSFVTTDSAFQYAENGIIIHDGVELNRQQKIKTIINYQQSLGKPYPLKVCSFKDRNCCECEKCFRTIIEIIAEGGKIQDFGFIINTPLVIFFQDVMNRNLGLWSIRSERKNFWEDTVKRMKENYDNIQEKEFVDWFLNYDFDKEQKRSRMNYYKTNFFSILKRKLHI